MMLGTPYNIDLLPLISIFLCPPFILENIVKETKLSVHTWTSSADDQSDYSNFFQKKKKKKSNFKFSSPYLDSAYKMHSNEYKQA